MGEGLPRWIVGTVLAAALVCAPASAHASILSSLFEHAAKHAARGAVESVARNVNQRAATRPASRRGPTTYWPDYTRYRRANRRNVVKPNGNNVPALRQMRRTQAAAARRMKRR